MNKTPNDSDINKYGTSLESRKNPKNIMVLNKTKPDEIESPNFHPSRCFFLMYMYSASPPPTRIPSSINGAENKECLK